MSKAKVTKRAGILTYRLIDGSMVNCRCIGEPYIGKIIEAQKAQQEEVVNRIIGTLEPIAEVEWHGKWRIQKAIDIIRQHFGVNAD